MAHAFSEFHFLIFTYLLINSREMAVSDRDRCSLDCGTVAKHGR